MPTLALACRIPIKRPVRANLAAGFTLLELLLVLTIIGMAAILVMPNVGNLDARSFGAQTRQASSLLNYARRLAVVRGQPSTASFYPASDDDRDPLGSTGATFGPIAVFPCSKALCGSLCIKTVLSVLSY